MKTHSNICKKDFKLAKIIAYRTYRNTMQEIKKMLQQLLNLTHPQKASKTIWIVVWSFPLL